MRIGKVVIDSAVEEKIFKRHGVGKEEVEEMLLMDEPKCFKARKGRYFAVGFRERFITAIFGYRKSEAEVVTAYPSSEWQIRLYKRK